MNLTPKEIAELEKMLDELEMPDYISDWGVDWDCEVPPVINCYHEWRKDSFFSANIYETCKKCGAKKEEL